MSKPDLILFTNHFPIKNTVKESWLVSEMAVTYDCYNKIIIVPFNSETDYIDLPKNCEVLNISKSTGVKLSFSEIVSVLRIVFSDFFRLQKNFLFYRLFRYNFALIKKYYKDAKFVYEKTKEKLDPSRKTVLYAYWADNLATCASIIKSFDPKYKIATRGHGFEIFEEQTKYGVILFRKFQLKYVDKIFADSKKGYERLLQRNPDHAKQLNYSYVGTNENGVSPFNTGENVIVSCAFIRRLKGVEFIPEVLMHVKSKVKWIHIGGGELMNEIEQKCKSLPSNVNVTLLGSLNAEQVIEFYKSHNISLFLSLSEREGLPVTLMEAISFGIPIAATDVGGCKEIINENTGFLIPEKFDQKKLANELDEFFKSEKNTETFRKKVKQYWKENFYSENNYKKFARQLQEL